jgi:hypothetical protein
MPTPSEWAHLGQPSTDARCRLSIVCVSKPRDLCESDSRYAVCSYSWHVDLNHSHRPSSCSHVGRRWHLVPVPPIASHNCRRGSPLGPSAYLLDQRRTVVSRDTETSVEVAALHPSHGPPPQACSRLAKIIEPPGARRNAVVSRAFDSCRSTRRSARRDAWQCGSTGRTLQRARAGAPPGPPR